MVNKAADPLRDETAATGAMSYVSVQNMPGAWPLSRVGGEILPPRYAGALLEDGRRVGRPFASAGDAEKTR